jgi:hypothetical protein
VGTAGKIRAGSVLVICLFVSGAFSLRGTDAAQANLRLAETVPDILNANAAVLAKQKRNIPMVRIYVFPDGQVAVADSTTDPREARNAARLAADERRKFAL